MSVTISEESFSPMDKLILENKSLESQLAAVKKELAEAQDKFQQIRDDAGTPLAISAELWEFSQSRCGHNFLSAQHALTSIIAHIDHIEQERDELRAKLEAEQWRDIDSAPKDGTHILGYFPGDFVSDLPIVQITCWMEDPPSIEWKLVDADKELWRRVIKHRRYYASELGGMPTLWRPLPDPPKAIDAAMSAEAEGA